MIKKIKLSKSRSVEVNTSMGWLLEYRSQFGRDILPDLLPAGEAIVELLIKTLQGVDKGQSIDLGDIIDAVSDDVIQDTFATLATLELLTVLQIVWAMAKNADPSIEEPETWMKGIDEFPVDKVVPELFRLIGGSLVSPKNLKRLKDLFGGLKMGAEAAS